MNTFDNADMSSASWNLRIVETEETQFLRQRIAIRYESTDDNLSFSCRLTTQRSALRCPHCHSVIYSRRHKLCGTCSRELPERLLFTSAEADRLEELLRTEQLRHRKWMWRKTQGTFAA